MKGEGADALKKKLEEQESEAKKREAEIVKAQNRAPGSPRGSGSTASSANRIKTSEYIRKVNALRESDPAAARQLLKDKDDGKIVVIADDLA
jgi:hypothetical protein